MSTPAAPVGRSDQAGNGTARRWPAAIWTLMAGTFLIRGLGFTYPFLPYHLDQLHLSTRTVSAVLAVFGAGWLLGSVMCGWLADRIGHRATLITTMLLAAVALPLLAQAQALPRCSLPRSPAASSTTQLARCSPRRSPTPFPTTASAPPSTHGATSPSTSARPSPEPPAGCSPPPRHPDPDPGQRRRLRALRTPGLALPARHRRPPPFQQKPGRRLPCRPGRSWPMAAAPGQPLRPHLRRKPLLLPADAHGRRRAHRRRLRLDADRERRRGPAALPASQPLAQPPGRGQQPHDRPLRRQLHPPRHEHGRRRLRLDPPRLCRHRRPRRPRRDHRLRRGVRPAQPALAPTFRGLYAGIWGTTLAGAVIIAPALAGWALIHGGDQLAAATTCTVGVLGAVLAWPLAARIRCAHLQPSLP